MKTSLLLLVSALAVCAQPGREIASGETGLAGGIGVKYRTYVVPDTKDPSLRLVGTGSTGGRNTMNHFIYDRTSQSYFGYSLKAEPAEGGLRITFGPMEVARVMQSLKAVAGDLPLNAAPLPVFPPPQVVHSGDTVALDLMVSPDGQHKIVDYLQFVMRPETPPEPSAAAALAEPRDFTVDDGRVRFGIPGPSELRVNGKTYVGMRAMVGNGEGSTFWFHVPDHGRYILSLVPHDGFVKAGSIRDNVIAFQAEGQSYELRLAGTVAGGPDGAWNLYLFHDPSYQPSADMAKGIWIGIDRLDNLMPKR